VTAHDDNRGAFARVVRSLDPYLGDLVFVGGWAHRLFALHELASPIDFQPLMTADTDIATPQRLRPRASSIRQLLQDNGFEEELSGDERPPVSEYRLGEEEGAFYVEFISPQAGGANKRDGSSDATVGIAGITAQKLKYLDVLFVHPWSVRLNASNGFPLGKDGLTVKIPNAPSYLMHKVLVLRERKLDKQSKDILYIHDTLLMFAAAFDRLRVAARTVAKDVHPNWLRTFNERRSMQFAAVDDRIRGAERIALETGRASPPSSEQIRRICQAGLDHIFGPGGPASR
jgi:hypothetical protein